MISNIPVIFEEAKENCSVFIQVSSDYNRMVQTGLATAFSDCGFRVTKTESDANYIAEVLVDENISGNDPLSIKPDINLKVVNKDGKSVYSYETHSQEKSIGYTLESAQKKAYPKLSKEIQDAVKENLDSVLKL